MSVDAVEQEARRLVWEAASKVFTDGPRAGGSAFAADRRAWQPEAAEELMRRLVDQPDLGGESFDEKLDKQLAGVSDESLLLFAELYYLCLLPLANYKTESKRNLINGVLARMERPVEMPQDLNDALSGHVFGGGVSFKTRRYWHLCYLIEFAHGFLADPLPEEVWSDPVEFRDHLDQVTQTRAPSQRFALLHLAFPDSFMPIISATHRAAILKHFSDVLDEPTGDADVDLTEVIAVLGRDESGPVDLYLEPWRSMWDPANAQSEGQGQRAWFVRGSAVDGKDLVPIWLRDGFVSLRAAKLRELPPGVQRDDLKEIVEDDYSQDSYAAKAVKLDEFHRFLSRIRVGDLVGSMSQGKFYVGTISGEPEFVASEDGRSNLRREVDWNEVGHDQTDLPASIKARLQIQYDVVEMTRQLELLEALSSAAEQTPAEATPEPVAEHDVVLPDATDELAESLNVDRAWLQECIDLLVDRPQLIFYGPPGTGKTYIAQHLAQHLAAENVRLVQFHPGYSYEDFFEGYRPQKDGFELRPGPLRKVVEAAKDNPSTPYVLIIDEINRGNLAKIFGELYFLLEYRDHNVDLLYATDDDVGFQMPKNIFIIGTMNTADRSIALVDAAMRRRFAFVSLHPTEPPTSEVLRRWLARRHRDPKVADLLDELNRRIDDPDFKIGPSYFMREAVFHEGGLERTWRTAILPLLEEHHYGEGIDVQEAYGLDAIRARVNTQAGAEQDVPDGPWTR